MQFFKSSGVLFAVLFIGTLIFITTEGAISTSNEESELTGMAKALDMLADACTAQFANHAEGLDIEWAGSEANQYCFCFAGEILIPLETEEKALETAIALVENTEIFDSFMRMESIFDRCVPAGYR